jgi:hypothetical protein
MTKAIVSDGADTPSRRKKAKRPTINAILKLEERLRDPTLTEQAEADIVAQMEKVLAEFYPVDPNDPSRGVVGLFRRRGRSSQSYLDYLAMRNAMVAGLGEVSALNQKQNLDKNPRDIKRLSKNNRNKRMAQEFLKRKSHACNDKSKSVLMEEIGKEHGLRRSAAIEAIENGLNLL